MNEILLFTQDKWRNIQVNVSNSSNTVVQAYSNWKIQLSNISSNLLTRFDLWPLRNRIINECRNFEETIANSWLAVKLNEVYDRCIYFLVTEVTGVHLYFGVICFIFGGIVGIGLSNRMSQSCVATPKMRALVCSGYEGLDSINFVEDFNAPRIFKPSQVLIHVKAASIDFVDIKVAKGYGRSLRKQLNKYNPNVYGELPTVLGRDCAGVVIAVGKNVSTLQAGDEVWLSQPVFYEGTLGEYVVAEEEYVAQKPIHLSHEGAAALPLDIIMAWDSLVKGAGLGEMTTAGKRVFIHSGTSSISLVAIQMVRAWGGHVTTDVPKNAVSLVYSLGADHVIEQTDEYCNELSSLDRFDVVFSPFASTSTEKSLKLLCTAEGMIVSPGFQNFPQDTMGMFIGTLYSAWITIKQIALMNWWVKGKSEYSRVISNKPLIEMTPLINSGQMKAVIDRSFAFQDSQFAVSYISKGANIGKTVLKFRNRPLASRSKLAQNSFV